MSDLDLTAVIYGVAISIHSRRCMADVTPCAGPTRDDIADAEVAVRHAAPRIERIARMAVAAEIEALALKVSPADLSLNRLYAAARIARGES